MELQTFWFIAVAFFWTGFFVLEGFDFGVGALHKLIGRDDVERRVVINTIGPVWDGNEVWLIVAGAAMFAAFPNWYATWFSSLYLAVWLLLSALILRGVSFEFRGKFQGASWRGLWSWTLTIGSIAAPFLLGVALGDLLAGLPVNADGDFTGSFADLFTPFGLLFGVTLVVLCLVHGAAFLGLRTTGTVLARSRMIVRALAIPGAVLVMILSVWIAVLAPTGVWGIIAVAIPILAAAAAASGAVLRRSRLVFIATAVTIGGVIVALFAHLYPTLLVSTDPSASLTVENSSSSEYSLQVMTVVALVMVPIVLAYQAWSYVVFRRRLTSPVVALAGVRDPRGTA
ncbi:cytochrome d ubiquinol oxidase subunit II [Microbacterium sp. B2969]|uniref:Cytochrome d ubiquinol oxidase subunit II n=1 Tax=Microbacterium alkaliflavum TaxID=3248839 RepID=A0ABW7Q2U9_9MICO